MKELFEPLARNIDSLPITVLSKYAAREKAAIEIMRTAGGVFNTSSKIITIDEMITLIDGFIVHTGGVNTFNTFIAILPDRRVIEFLHNGKNAHIGLIMASLRGDVVWKNAY